MSQDSSNPQSAFVTAAALSTQWHEYIDEHVSRIYRLLATYWYLSSVRTLSSSQDISTLLLFSISTLVDLCKVIGESKRYHIVQNLKNYLTHKHQTTLTPGLSFTRRDLLHTVWACAKYSVIFSIKSFMHFLVCMRKNIPTKNRASFELNSGDELTCRTLLGYYFSDKAVSFF